MKFNREHLEELTLQKIKEVNDEAGYRKYLEVPEMVNIIATIIEEKFSVEYNDLVNQIHLLSKELEEYRSIAEKVGAAKAVSEKEKLEKIINDTLRALPVGSISRHTPESIPERVQGWVKEAAEECYFREKWEACADRLIVYAKEIQATVINQALYEAVCEDIEKYKKLKNEADGTV